MAERAKAAETRATDGARGRSPIENLVHPQHQFLADTPALFRLRPWHLGLALGLAALGLYLATMAWKPSGSESLAFMVAHLGYDRSLPLDNLPWDAWMRLARHLPGLGVAGWTGLLCALLGASSVGLLTWLMGRVAFFYTPDATAATVRREALARRLSAATAGVFLMVASPMWWSASRALPGTLGLAWLLSCAGLFSAFQRSGRVGWLAALGAAWGLGCAWNATFWLLTPALLFLALRELFRWRIAGRGAPYAALLAPMLAGAACIFLAAGWAWRHGGDQLYPSVAAVVGAMASGQAAAMGLDAAMTPLMLLMLAVAMAPWWILFPLSRRSPWYYEPGQTAIRLLLAAHVVVLLWGTPYAPWRLVGGLGDPFLLPVAFLAAAIGYLAGEFWCMGEIFPFKDSAAAVRAWKRFLSAFAWLLAPACLAVGVARNLVPILESRAGAAVWEAANRVLDEAGGREVFFAGGLFDDALALAAEGRHADILLFREPARQSPLYRKALAAAVPALADLLDAGADYSRLLPRFLSLPGAAESTVLVPGGEFVRNVCAAEPRGYAWHPLPPGVPLDAAALLRREEPFLKALADWQAKPLPAASAEAHYRRLLCALASRSANDIGVELARAGYARSARSAFAMAVRLNAENLSACLNDAQLQTPQDPSVPLSAWTGMGVKDEVVAQLAVRAEANAVIQARSWTLGPLYGEVLAPEAWLMRGLPWAISGAPLPPEAFQAPPADALVGLRSAPDAERWFQCVFARIGLFRVRPDQVCAVMARAPLEPEPLAELARTYLMDGRPALAVACLEAALARLPPDHPGFGLEEILADAALAGTLPLRFPPHDALLADVPAPPAPHFPRRWTSHGGFPVGFRQALLALAGAHPSDVFPWIAFWMLEPSTPTGQMAEAKLKARLRTVPALALSMAAAGLQRGDEAGAESASALLGRTEAALSSSPVLWRLAGLAAERLSDEPSARLSYSRLQDFLPPAVLEEIWPRLAEPVFGTRLRSEMCP